MMAEGWVKEFRDGGNRFIVRAVCGVFFDGGHAHCDTIAVAGRWDSGRGRRWEEWLSDCSAGRRGRAKTRWCCAGQFGDGSGEFLGEGGAQGGDV